MALEKVVIVIGTVPVNWCEILSEMKQKKLRLHESSFLFGGKPILVTYQAKRSKNVFVQHSTQVFAKFCRF